MSLKKNIVASYASQIYVTVIGIVLVPQYIKYMGAEAYGLVGFFAMIQAWFNLLDLGLTPAIARESARYHGGTLSSITYRQLIRSTTIIFSIIALIGGGAIWLFSESIATRWLKADSLSSEVMDFCVQIMAFSIAMRWMAGLFRGIITGAERLVWLSSYNAFIASCRFVLVFFSMATWGFEPNIFFMHQLFVAIIEIIGLYLYSRNLLPILSNREHNKIGWKMSPVKNMLKFSLGIAFSSTVWAIVTQTDKLILSGIISLEEYSYFTLAVLVANGILILSSPITNSILPRMVKINEENKKEKLIELYVKSTQMISVFSGVIGMIISIFSENILFAWTGDSIVVENTSKILSIYSMGTIFLLFSGMPYYLQYAAGKLKYHNIGNMITLMILPLSIIVLSVKFGATGAAWAWFIFHFLGLVFWSAFVHSKLIPKKHVKWFVDGVILPLLPTLIICVLFVKFINFNILTRMESVIFVAVVVLACLSATYLFFIKYLEKKG